MEWYHYVLIGLAAVIVAIIVFSYIQGKKASVRLTSDEFKNGMRKGQLIDVRTKKEFDSGHINGARNMSVGMITREYSKLRKDQPIYLYCANGKRCRRAAAFLQTKGYKGLYQLENGLKSWTGPLK